MDDDPAKFWGCPEKGSWNWGSVVLWYCNGLGVLVRSNVTVGNGAEAEMVAMLDEHGRIALASKLGFINPSPLDIEPESNIVAAAVVVDAMAIAAGGSGWLWFPS